MASVHSEESVRLVGIRRQHAGAPEGSCANCANAHGTPRNCLGPRTCIHGWARAQVRSWAAENPDWGKGRKGAPDV